MKPTKYMAIAFIMTMLGFGMQFPVLYVPFTYLHIFEIPVWVACYTITMIWVGFVSLWILLTYGIIRIVKQRHESVEL